MRKLINLFKSHYIKQKEKPSRKLTEEEKQKVISVVDNLILLDFPDEQTEYDVLMKQKREEFKLHILKDDDPYQIEALLNLCDEYLEGDMLTGLAFIIMYDMWLNKSPVWPVGKNPEWEEWEKLKRKKVDPKKTMTDTTVKKQP